MPNRYTRIAILLHWTIALAIILQLASGLWMHEAIEEAETKALAYKVYQWHKALGLSVLVLSLFRLAWRITHPAPPLPAHMPLWEKWAAHGSHALLYAFMIGVPLLGWAMVSSSSFGLPTMYFGLFEWPHIPGLTGLEKQEDVSEFFEESHELTAYAMAALIGLHVTAALKHQIIDRDEVLSHMIPFLRPRSSK